jgi:hypothetical protein
MSCILRKSVLGSLLILASLGVVAQNINDFSYKRSGSNIEVQYSLSGQPTDKYEVLLYGSHDNFSNPLKLVSGDVGENINPGTGKSIIWQAQEELGQFKGNFSLKLKTQLNPFVTFTIAKGEKFKMGKTQTIAWEGNAENLKLELYQNEIKISDIGLASSGKSYNWQLPKKGLAKGGNYRIKGSANGRSELSEAFEIKKKMPIYIWAIPVVIAGGVIAILSGGDSNNNPENNTIPPPIGPN